MSYLSELHPEVFFAVPRPGGIARIAPLSELIAKASTTRPGDRRSSKTTLKTTTTAGGGIFDAPNIYSSTPQKSTREYRIKKVLSSSPWVLFDDADADSDNPLPPDPVHDTMIILAISISTIMLMAAEHGDIPKDHLQWTLSYLECIKDEYGNYPPNIRGIMNNINMIDGNLSSFLDNEDEPPAPAPTPEEPAEE